MRNEIGKNAGIDIEAGERLCTVKAVQIREGGLHARREAIGRDVSREGNGRELAAVLPEARAWAVVGTALPVDGLRRGRGNRDGRDGRGSKRDGGSSKRGRDGRGELELASGGLGRLGRIRYGTCSE